MHVQYRCPLNIFFIFIISFNSLSSHTLPTKTVNSLSKPTRLNKITKWGTMLDMTINISIKFVTQPLTSKQHFSFSQKNYTSGEHVSFFFFFNNSILFKYNCLLLYLLSRSPRWGNCLIEKYST